MMPTSRRPPRAMRISRLSPHLSPLAPTRSPLFQLYTLIATSRRPRHVELVTVVSLGAVLPVHGAATEAQHRRPFRRVVVHRGKQVAQQRAVDAVVPRARARARGAGAPRAPAPHVARHDQVLLVVKVQLAERHVRSRACHVDVEVAWAHTAVRGGHAANNRLAEGSEEGVLVARAMRRSWRARQNRPTVRHRALHSPARQRA